MASRGSVYQRKDGRWVGKLPLPKDPLTGKKQKTKYVYSSVPPIPKSKWKKDSNGELIIPPFQKGKQEAEAKLEALIREVDSGDLSNVKKVTVSGWLRQYTDTYCDDKEDTTKDGYRIYIENHIIPAFGDILLRELRSIHIANFYKNERNAPRYKTKIEKGKTVPIMKDGEPVPLMKEGEPVIGYSEKTILQEHRILRRAFSKAVADGLMSRNPCDGVDAPSPKDYKPNVYTAEDYLILLDKLLGHRMEAAVLIVGMCGLRRAECAGLDWQKSLDLNKGTIRIHETVVATSNGNKTKEPKNETSMREFAIPSAIIPRLKELQGIGKVLARIDGGEYNPGSISTMFREFLEKNNLKHIRFHDLRHFNATMMLKSGISDKEASVRLGHSSPSITRKIYQHVLDEMDKENADKLNSVLTPTKEPKAKI
jgi:integrase